MLGHTMRATGDPGPMIVGVLAPEFHLYFPPEANVETAPDIWIADRLTYDATSRNEFTIRPVGRLKDGVSLEHAQAAAENVAAEARNNFPLWQTGGFHIEIEPMRQHLVREVRPAILALMGSGIFLLLIACANVANLLLVRASLARTRTCHACGPGCGSLAVDPPILVEAFSVGRHRYVPRLSPWHGRDSGIAAACSAESSPP